MSNPQDEVNAMSRINRYVDRQLATLEPAAAARVLSWFQDVLSKKDLTNPPQASDTTQESQAAH